MNKLKFSVWTLMSTACVLVSCDKSDRSYSLLSDSQQFQQNPGGTVNNKIDILWVVDNSGSMAAFQQRLAQNFNSFMSNFITKGYDYHIAVTTSDAYLAGSAFRNNLSYSRFKDGQVTHTGFPIIDLSTPNPLTVFSTNSYVDDNGSGDERAFSSFKAALANPQNSAFLRPGAFLAVIILSDEDDFSDPSRPEGSWQFQGGVADHSYSNSHLETVQSYVSYLDTLTGSDPAARRYNVSAVTVLDNTCLASHRQQTSATIIGQRYISLANATGGVLADLCSPSYATALEQIQQRISELSTQFFLNRAPNPTSIQVWVNGLSIPSNATNGWTYIATSNAIMFHGTAVPPQGATINVAFDPLAPIQ